MSKGWARTCSKNKNGAASFKIFNGFLNFVLVKKINMHDSISQKSTFNFVVVE
jgi:hypothetical protein